jgi:hypothetical protein
VRALARRAPCYWSDDLFDVESRSLPVHAWLPAGPWTASVEWMSGGDLWKALPLD